ncbi:MAG: ribonuclease J [Candidatus Pacebacteria bacterium]|jgi:ribonuclease J|nr:ribonuclease J [Candidatus Paceibacterota bacterium]
MSKLKFLALGGMGRVTQNLYLYQYQQEIILIDCGIGFPDIYMPGVDALIPDITYLLNQVEAGAKIVGMILSHGHDDHIGALPYLLPNLPDFPIYASPLTAQFAHDRLLDKKVDRSIQVLSDRQNLALGQYFKFQFIAITHSIPDTKHILLETPVGKIYHGSDFKLDKHPVDGRLSDMDFIEQIGRDDNLLMACLDCLRVERDSWTPSESTVGPALLREMKDVEGKVLVTLMSSHLHRIQQTIDACKQLGRKVVFVGRSVEQNIKSAAQSKSLNVPQGLLIDKKKMKQIPDNKLCIIIAGSQGQEGSSLVRAVYGDHQIVQISNHDKVIFSADVIPGNEIPYYSAIDQLAADEVDVVYPDIRPDIHRSGHASRVEQELILKLLKPKFVMPIGGADRHRSLFKKIVAKPLSYQDWQILLPKTGEILEIDQQRVSVAQRISLSAKIIDGLGIGDVGPIVLSDRLNLSKAGIIVLILPRFKKKFDFNKMQVISRGFVFMKEADEVIKYIKKETISIIQGLGKNVKDEELKHRLEKRLARRLFKIIRREPMILSVIWDS